MKKTILLISVLLLAIVAFFQNGCKKKENNDKPAATCSDKIRNQGETGVDCGGPCPACTFLCNGNGSGDYFPLALKNFWKYDNGYEHRSYTIKETVTIKSKTYYKVFITDTTSGVVWSWANFFRIDNNGDVYKMPYYPGDSITEELEVPAHPYPNQSWDYDHFTRKVFSINASVKTDSCIYDGCLEIGYIAVHSHTIGLDTTYYYYKKGIGLIRGEFLTLSVVKLN